MMKKIITVLLVMVIYCVSGCSDGNDKAEVYDDKDASGMSERVIEYFEQEDESSLEALFCQQVQESHVLSEEIKGAFEFIAGDITSYDTPEGSTGGGIIKDGERTELVLRGKVANIETDTGNVYSLYIHSYAINKENEEYVGITYIDIFLEEESGKTVSTEAQYTIGEYVE